MGWAGGLLEFAASVVVSGCFRTGEGDYEVCEHVGCQDSGEQDDDGDEQHIDYEGSVSLCVFVGLVISGEDDEGGHAGERDVRACC